MLLVTLIAFQSSPIFGLAVDDEDPGSSSTPLLGESVPPADSTQATPNTNIFLSPSNPSTSIPDESSTSSSTATSSNTIPIDTPTPISTGTSSENIATSTVPDTSTSMNATPTPPLSDTFISTGTSTSSTISSTTPVEGVASTTEAADASTTTLPEGTTTVATGDAVSLANVLNILNTNLVNSTGSIILSNLPDGQNSSVDFRPIGTATTACTLVSCSGISSMTTHIEADASIDNAIAVVATSGDNLIDTASHAVITSGNTIAGLNLVNVANTNFIDSNYFLLSLNSFNTVNGDIVLPSLSNFFSHPYIMSDGSSITTNQTATIANNLAVDAVAGNNTASSSLSSLISSGDAVSSTNVYNNVGSMLVGGGSVSVLLKVSGAWIGQLFGAPDGNIFDTNGATHTLHIDQGTPMTSSSAMTRDITSSSTATINNDINILSLSGSNTTHDTDTSVIQTGTARASANLINIANTNVIGRNWILAIINIFGDFNGNISFGKPDLWLGEQVTASAPFIENGSGVTYKLTLINKGDSNASGINLSSTYDAAHLDITSSSVPYTETSAGTVTFAIGTLTPNEAREITFHATIKNTAAGTDISNTSKATLTESDANYADNTDTATLTTSVQGGGGGTFTLPAADSTIPGNIVITNTSPLTVLVQRTTPVETIIGIGTKNEETILIRNLTDNPIKSSTFEDVLYNKDGNEVRRETFDLGDLLPHEEVTVAYDVTFGALAQSGTYTLSSELYYSPSKKRTFTSNGYIYYTAMQNTSPVPSAAVATGTPSLTKATSTVSSRSIHRHVSAILPAVHKVGQILGAFTETLSSAHGYAETVGKKTASTTPSGFAILQTLFFLLASGSHLIRRYFIGA